jgi:hypothetical protein
MKTKIALLVMSAALVAAASVQANDAHHPASATQGSAPAPKAAAKKPAPAGQPSDQRFEDARRQMQKMLAQMDEIRQTKDPAVRQRLMDEHMRTMQDTMQSMHAMGGPMMMDMMGQQGTGGVTSNVQSGKRGSGVNERMDMMERRMDMMQMMMEQMLQQQKSPPSAQ